MNRTIRQHLLPSIETASHMRRRNKSRILILMVVAVVVATGLMTRLIDIQLIRGYIFFDQAEENRFYTQPLIAHRGALLDRYGEALTWNQRRYILVDNPDSLSRAGTEISHDAALKVLATDSAQIDFATQRYYHFPLSLGQVVGYVGPVTSEELKLQPQLKLYHVVGKLGLEKLFDETLRGRDGKERWEMNARGMRQRTVSIEPAIAGQNVVTTLDPWLSEVARSALGEQQGSVVISDASSGAILAMVNQPSFDPNLLSSIPSNAQERASRSEQLRALLSDPRRRMFNRALSGSYPPGSIFKLVTALAGLGTQQIDRTTTVVDEGSLKIGEYEYRNWYATQYGRTEGEIALERALARSNDIYFYKVAEWVGPTALAEWARRFGLGSAPGSGLGAEAIGLVPDPAWKERVVGERWFLGNTYHFGIGQGDLLVSPLQIAQLIQTIAHQGQRCRPHFSLNESLDCRDMGISRDDLDMVLQGMIDACSTGGTAFPFFTYNESVTATTDTASAWLSAGAAACKTGTAEFGSADERGYRKTHGWFALIIEPQLAEVVQEEDSEWGAGVESRRSPSAQVDSDQWYASWRAQVAEHGFPERLSVVVLVESDDQDPFKEGSVDAAPVAKTIVDWLSGKDS